VLEPEYVSRLVEASARLSNCMVAEVSVSRAGGVAVAETLVGSALAALNLVQHMENKPLVDRGTVAALLAQFSCRRAPREGAAPVSCPPRGRPTRPLRAGAA
jgi:hypothetical protein